MTRTLREVLYLTFSIGLLLGLAIPPDFDRVTHAFYSDLEGATDNLYEADFVTIPSAAACSAFWALKSSGSDTIKITGAAHRFEACLYSNSSVSLGSGSTYNGTIRYVTTLTNGSNTFNAPRIQVPTLSYPFAYNIVDYRPTGCRALAVGPTHYTNVGGGIVTLTNPASGVYYGTGTVKVKTTNAVARNLTILSEDKVDFDLSTGNLGAYIDDLVAFANGTGNAGITVSTKGLMEGVLTAPNGDMNWQTSNNVYRGQVVANTISVSAQNDTFVARPPTNVTHCTSSLGLAGATSSGVATPATEPIVGAPSPSGTSALGPTRELDVLLVLGEIVIPPEHDWSREE